MPENAYPGLLTTGGPLSVDELATQLPLDETVGQIGMWCVPNRMFGYGSALTAAASTYYLTRFVARRRMTVIKIGYVVTTFSATNDNADVGVFSAAGARLTSSGATAGQLNTSNGVKTITVPAVNLNPGTVYYAGFAYGASAAPASLAAVTSNQTANMGTMFGSTAGTLEIAQAGGATLPASASFATPSATVVALAMLEA